MAVQIVILNPFSYKSAQYLNLAIPIIFLPLQNGIRKNIINQILNGEIANYI